MSVGPVGGRGGITGGINALLSQLSSSRVGPQGAGGGRPPVDGIEPLTSRPGSQQNSFQQRYQQDSFESGPRQGSGRRGGGLDLTGQGRGGGQQARASAGAGEDPEALLKTGDQKGQKKRSPVEVTEFPKGQQPKQ